MLLAFILVALCIQDNAAELTRVQFGGTASELVISEVSDRTVRVDLLAADAALQNPGPTLATVLVPFPSTEKFRARDLAGEQKLSVGRLQIVIKPRPLTVTIRRADGRLVQELVFGAGDDREVAFRTEAPVFGLGEGAQQFDRRGARYSMEPSWGGWNRPVLGSVVPSPFLIGTDGWALFASQPEGEFDLRDWKGRFLPKTAGALSLFVVDVQEPVDALTEYIRLAGHPVMPPKWALGYFQSHRTLGGPDEPLEIARIFREKKLPCDALIYLGTGYCTNGWNTGHGSLVFNPNAFPHPAENIAALHALNFKVVLHVNHAPRNLFGASITENSDSPIH
ncbi:MAG TPA: TIM-barrel domain-containing protein, partial [Verrucomicrobiae bacterium]|nr:TIM-barrel domain-containing protein [Verrucomicrobiae bacterium]